MSDKDKKTKKQSKQEKYQNKHKEIQQSGESSQQQQLFDKQFALQLGDPKKQVRVNTFKGKVMIHFRQYYQKDGKWLPTQKGTTISKQQWEVIKNNIGRIDKAIKKLG